MTCELLTVRYGWYRTQQAASTHPLCKSASSLSLSLVVVGHRSRQRNQESEIIFQFGRSHIRMYSLLRSTAHPPQIEAEKVDFIPGHVFIPTSYLFSWSDFAALL
uniref:Uncharacterized protein n=1 Tax=Nelumbo nucifera TaxID=4432 RepID=A0A822YNZ0_NELNU|nr:TPA_asm: hypothetical protein HUJ06_004960 [Nelumbo nucifera]